MPTESLPIHIRWMIRPDLGAALAIETATFRDPWTEEAFLRTLRKRSVVPAVAEVMDPGSARHGQIAGFLVYELSKWKLQVLNLAVGHEWRRQRVGARLLASLRRKLTNNEHICRASIVVDVLESNLPMQLFLRAQGWRCNTVLRGDDRDGGEDTFRFAWRRGGLNEWDSSTGGTSDVDTACRAD